MIFSKVLDPIMDMPKLGNRPRLMARWSETRMAKKCASLVRLYMFLSAFDSPSHAGDSHFELSRKRNREANRCGVQAVDLWL
jgi:hypothetical protein